MNILTASPNTSFAAHSVRPNAFGTSQSPRTLDDILLGDLKAKNIKPVTYPIKGG